MPDKRVFWLFLGDVAVLALVTLFGFANHSELDADGKRMLATFIPLLVSWLMVAPFLGAYDLARQKDVRQSWRVFYAMVLAGPFAGFLRGVMLGNAPVMPIFVVVIGGISALSLLVWRLFYWLVAFRNR